MIRLNRLPANWTGLNTSRANNNGLARKAQFIELLSWQIHTLFKGICIAEHMEGIKDINRMA